MKVLAIIPARGGSKGIPKKNSLIFDGLTLVDYAIKSAIESQTIKKTIVSSDDELILNNAKNYKNVHIHKRIEKLASDTSPIIDTVLELVKDNPDFEYLVLLQPTSPLRKGIEIDKAVNILKQNKDLSSVISVVETDDVHPARMYWSEKNHKLNPILPEFEQHRRQDIPKALYRNGAIYVCRLSALLKQKSIMAKPSGSFIMDGKYLLNIDDKRDLIIAESLIKAWKNAE